MINLQYVTFGSISSDLHEVSKFDAEIGLYILTNLELCKRSIIFVTDNFVLFIITNPTYQPEIEKRINFNSVLTKLEISSFNIEDVYDNSNIEIKFKNSNYTLLGIHCFSIDISINNVLIERIFLSQSQIYKYNTRIKTKFFNYGTQ